MVQMFLMQTIPQSAEQEKFVLKRIISSICFRGMLTLKLKYSTVEINMVNYFTTKPHNGDNPYHKELFHFLLRSRFKKHSTKITVGNCTGCFMSFCITINKTLHQVLVTTIKVVQISAARPACCRVQIIKSVPDQEGKAESKKKKKNFQCVSVKRH